MKKILIVLAVACALLLIGQVHALSQTPAGSDFYYVWDTKECQVIDYMCDEGWNSFSDASGCGCKKIQDTDPDVICTQEYAPVCWRPHTDCPEGAVCMIPLPVTYSNKCHLEAADATLLYEGVCEQDKPRACTEEWAPVCGKTQPKACMWPGCASELKTYSNKCFLEGDNAIFQYEGECRDETPLPEPTKTKYYVGDTQMCQIMDYMCDEGWNYFSDEIWCGCEKIEDDDDILSSDIKERIESIIAKFINSLESKGYSNEKISDTIALVIIKIEVLKAQKPQYAAILNYTIQVLEEYASQYEDDLDIIKKIFQDF